MRLWKCLSLSVPLAAALVLGPAGCASGPAGHAGATARRDKPLASDVLRKDDIVTVIFSNIPTPRLPHEEKIKDDGNITLADIGPIKAEGKTAGQLQKEIQDAYVPRYYRNMTVTVKPPERFFYVQGEVKVPNRYQHTTGMTVLKAITTAGGFTDFAGRTKVELTSITGEKYTIDCKRALKNSALDLPVYSDDRIDVPKRFY
jgi:polysaccharide export outer membrane protein